MKLAIENIQFSPTVETDETRETELQENIQGIAESIKEIGLSHPVIVRPGDNGNYILVSGEKRIRAALTLKWTEIESEVRGVSEIQGKIIQTHENLKRYNLPWWESALLMEALHRFRQEEHGDTQIGRPKKDEKKSGWGIRDTARELGLALGPVAESLQLARAVQLDPSLRNIRDKKTAVRLVKVAARRHEAEEEAGLSADIEVNQAYLGDATEILSRFPSGACDHCITDPPWINFFDESLTLDKRTLPVFKEVYRVLRLQGFLYMFCGLDDYSYYCGYDRRDAKGQIQHTWGELEKIGFKISKTPLIWHKTQSMSRRGMRSWEYERDFEFIIVATKGNPALTSSIALSGVKTFPAVPVKHLIHPNEKPVDLIKDILRDCSYEGNIILDPFGGSFVTAAACKEMKRRFVICERDKKFYDAGRKRLEI
jgi:DNA modification methylase